MKKVLLALCLSCTSLGLAQNLKQEAVETYAAIVLASYQDSLQLAEELKSAIDAFIASPSGVTHQTAKDAWLAAQEPYGQTEAYRFYGGPIDDENGPEGLLNAWPLDEAYIDYVEGATESGIINNLTAYPEINKELLISLNEVGAEENIATGYHAIEFLLWGQDFSADTNGQRPYTDYTTAPNAERRAAYLAALAELLVENLNYVVDAWHTDNTENYREAFITADPNASLSKMLTGIGVLAKSELAGERIFTAYDNRDQEDEHSCFSDNTHRDIATNFMGIQNVYLGSYTKLDGSIVEGTGLKDVVAEIDTDLNNTMLELLAISHSETMQVSIPFDQAISSSETRPQIFSLVSSLLDLGDSIAQVGSTLGLSINTALP